MNSMLTTVASQDLVDGGAGRSHLPRILNTPPRNRTGDAMWWRRRATHREWARKRSVRSRALAHSQICTTAAGRGARGRAISVAMARDSDAERESMRLAMAIRARAHGGTTSSQLISVNSPENKKDFRFPHAPQVDCEPKKHVSEFFVRFEFRRPRACTVPS